MLETTDLEITFTKLRNPGSTGNWLSGRINAKYRFVALVFEDHAETEAYELGRSKISKLWVQRIADKKQVFNFDRGLDIPATDAEVQVVVDFLAAGLADHLIAAK